MTITDTTLGVRDLKAAELAELLGLTVWQVEERCRREIFKCHWRGNGRYRRFTPEDVAYNRNVDLRPARTKKTTVTPRMRKGATKLRRLSEANAA